MEELLKKKTLLKFLIKPVQSKNENHYYMLSEVVGITYNYQKFGVPIDIAKMNKKVRFRTEAPLIQYHQNLLNSCCLSSLASAFHCIGDYRDVTSLIK